MRKLAILTVALLAALSGRRTRGDGRFRLEPPRSTTVGPRSHRRRHRRLCVRGPRRSRVADPDRQLDPLRGSGRRPELLPLRRSGVVLPQRRQHRRRQVRHPLPVQVQDQGPQPQLVPVRVAGRELGQRSEAQPRADVLGLARALRARPSGEQQAGGQGPAHGAEQRRAQDVPQLRRGRQPGDQGPAGRWQGLRRPGRRPVLRRPRLDLRRHQHRHAGPHGHRHGQPGRRQGRSRRLQRPHDRPAGAEVRRHP